MIDLATRSCLAACTILLSAYAMGCGPGQTAAASPPRSSAEHTSSSAALPAAARVYLEIILKVDPANRPAAAAIYTKYKQPFLDTVPGAQSKQLLLRDEDVVVLHGFDTVEHASAYLKSSLFTNDVVVGLKPLLAASPDVRIYATP